MDDLDGFRSAIITMNSAIKMMQVDQNKDKSSYIPMGSKHLADELRGLGTVPRARYVSEHLWVQVNAFSQCDMVQLTITLPRVSQLAVKPNFSGPRCVCAHGGKTLPECSMHSLG